MLPRTMSGFCSCGARGDTCKDASFALCKQGIRKWVRESILKAPPHPEETGQIWDIRVRIEEQ